MIGTETKDTLLSVSALRNVLEGSSPPVLYQTGLPPGPNRLLLSLLRALSLSSLQYRLLVKLSHYVNPGCRRYGLNSHPWSSKCDILCRAIKRTNSLANPLHTVSTPPEFDTSFHFGIEKRGASSWACGGFLGNGLGHLPSTVGTS